MLNLVIHKTGYHFTTVDSRVFHDPRRLVELIRQESTPECFTDFSELFLGFTVACAKAENVEYGENWQLALRLTCVKPRLLVEDRQEIVGYLFEFETGLPDGCVYDGYCFLAFGEDGKMNRIYTEDQFHVNLVPDESGLSQPIA